MRDEKQGGKKGGNDSTGTVFEISSNGEDSGLRLHPTLLPSWFMISKSQSVNAMRSLHLWVEKREKKSICSQENNHFLFFFSPSIYPPFHFWKEKIILQTDSHNGFFNQMKH